MSVYEQYPHFIAAIAPHVRDWADLSPDERDAWILEALSNIDHQNRDDIEVGRAYTATGSPVTVDLTDAMLATIRDAAELATTAQRDLERLVSAAARGLGNITAVADAASVTRQTVYRWAATD